jgi:predicted  nucleic acid-binding Zn-ribbon protein
VVLPYTREGAQMADEHQVRAHEQNFADLKDAIKEIELKLFKGAQKISVTESSLCKLEKRMDSREDELVILTRLVVGVEHLGAEVKDLVQTVKYHGDEIEALKIAPGKKALEYWQAFIVAVITGIAGIFLALAFTGQIGG